MSNVCAICNQVVTDMGDAVEAIGKLFHKDCTECSLCGGPHDFTEYEEWLGAN